MTVVSKMFQATKQASVSANSTAYASGDLVGGLISLTGLVPYKGGGAVIQTISLSDLDKQSLAADVIFFRQNPTGTTFTNNSALDVADADLPYAFHASIAASDYAAFNDNSVATVNPSRAFKLNDTSVLYACIVTRGAPTYSSTGTALKLTVEVI